MRRLVRWFLREARDWAFALVGFAGAMMLPTFDGNWLFAAPVIVLFLALYAFACFATSRWFDDGDETGAAQ